jgi:hypothetical protein
VFHGSKPCLPHKKTYIAKRRKETCEAGLDRNEKQESYEKQQHHDHQTKA